MSYPPPRTAPPWRVLIPASFGIGLALWFGAGLLLHAFFVRSFFVPSDAMAPTIRAGQKVTVDTRSHGASRGEIVVYSRAIGPEPTSGHRVKRDFIKRIVAVGGDTIRCCDPNGKVLVNGRPVDEPYTSAETEPFASVTVPAHQMFLLGDNRPNSADSRFDGPVPTNAIVGRVIHIGGFGAVAYAWLYTIPFVPLTVVFAGLGVTIRRWS